MHQLKKKQYTMPTIIEEETMHTNNNEEETMH